jgi:hypothetical protein
LPFSMEYGDDDSCCGGQQFFVLLDVREAHPAPVPVEGLGHLFGTRRKGRPNRKGATDSLCMCNALGAGSDSTIESSFSAFKSTGNIQNR